MLDSDLDHEDSRAQRTIELSQRFATQFKTIEDFDIVTAEATAKLINENKIIPGLLKIIFEPGPKKLGHPHTECSRSSKAGPQEAKPKNTTPNDERIETIKPEEDEPHSTNQTTRDYKMTGPASTHSRKPLTKLVKGKSSVGRMKTDNSRGVVEPFKIVTESATKKPCKVARNLVSAHEVEDSVLKGAKVASPKTANSEKKSAPKGSRFKAIRTLPRPPPAGNDPTQVVQVEVSSSSSQPRQDSPSRAPKDRDVARSPHISVPLHEPKLSLDTVMSAPYLLSPACPLKERRIPRTRSLGSLQKESSAVTSDTVNGDNITYGYPPEGDSSLTEPVKSIDDPSPLITCGAQGLRWAYLTCTNADEALLKAGIWLWERPPTYFYPHRLSIKMSDPAVLAPVIVSHESTGSSVPLMEYSGETVHIIPHEEPWEDVRSSECHPDFLPPCKLVEYQACEAAGYYIWRHDRDQLPCRKPDCEAMIMDYHASSVLCLGCGPKTIVRYCSFEHQVEHIGGHLAECGHPNLVMQCLIDHATAPPYFSDKPPEIIGMQEFKSAALKRQKIYFMKNGGYYTLFDPITHEPKTLSWPQIQSNWRELNRRIERLLNIAYLGICSSDVIKYIYRLLSGLLCIAKELTYHVEELLEKQFREEFDYRGRLDTIYNGAPRDFRWTNGHDRTRLSVFKKGGSQLCTTDLQTWVVRMENKHWILRAWQQQHPTEKDWRVRGNGYGMISVEAGEEIYRLGPGWTGWGGREENQRDSDWGRGRKL